MNNTEISTNVLNEILEIAEEIGVSYDCFEGCLRDNYVFYSDECISIEGKSSKYLIIKERYLNEWSSDLILIMTNSTEEVENFKGTLSIA